MITRAVAVYDVIAGILLGRAIPDGKRLQAFGARQLLWERALALEGCAVRFGRALRASPTAFEATDALPRMLRVAASASFRDGIRVHRQLEEMAELGGRHGVRLMALKGAARLAAGEPPGLRSISDIDVLVPPAHARRFHGALREELGYHESSVAESHHLAGLSRAGSLGVEVHIRLSSAPLPLDAAIWRGARRVSQGAHELEIPSATDLLLHTLEHAVGLNWSSRYRLRDILDVAELCGGGIAECTDARQCAESQIHSSSDQRDSAERVIDVSAVRAYTRGSPHRNAIETLLSAAHELDARVPCTHARGWRTVRRIARARIAAASLPGPRDPVTARRLFSYVGVAAEGSPRSIARMGSQALQRGNIAFRTMLAAALTAGCSEAIRPSGEIMPPFVFVSSDGTSQGLYSWRSGVVTRLSTGSSSDTDPHSAAGLIVFTSDRDGNAELYLADLELTAPRRVTTNDAYDGEGALSPAGDRVAFVSTRGGTPRIWIHDVASGDTKPLETGSRTFIAERSPMWDPSGFLIAFTSTRTNTSQVYTVPATGGVAEQVTREAGGAFEPSWVAQGRAIVYVAAAGAPRLATVPAGGADGLAYAEDALGLGSPACARALCLAVRDPFGEKSAIVAVSGPGALAAPVAEQAGGAKQPAILVR